MNRPEDWTRLERLQYLLDNWATIFDSEPGGIAAGDPIGIALLPQWANHPSVKELDRCLILLSEHSPVQYRHLKAYRCGAEWRTVPAKRRIQLPSGKWENVDTFKAERIKPSWVDRGKVRSAEQFLADTFQGTVYVPDDLWESARYAAEIAA